MSSGDDQVAGWKAGDHDRSTADILWPCLATLFLCTWSIVHLNIPGPEERFEQIVARHVKWMCLALIAPEMITGIAFEQLVDAMSCRQKFSDIGHKFDLRFAFYLRMGGFFFGEASGNSSTPYQMDWREVYQLVANQRIDMPATMSKVLGDRTKNGALVKFLACAQAVWFLIRCIARVATDLPITELELCTLAYVIVSLITYLCWWHKPQDILERKLIKAEPMGAGWTILGEQELISQSNDEEAQTNGQVNRAKASMSRSQSLPIVGNNQDFFTARLRPLYSNRIPNMDFKLHIPSTFTGSQLKQSFMATTRHFAGHFFIGPMFSMFVGVVFGGLHIVAWRFFFPSDTEALLWRICSLAITLAHPVMFASYLITTLPEPLFHESRPWNWLTEKGAPAHIDIATASGTTNSTPRYLIRIYRKAWRQMIILHERNTAQSLLNNEGTRWHLYGLHATCFTFCIVVYGISRIILLILMFISLRKVPTEIYRTLPWFSYVPLI